MTTSDPAHQTVKFGREADRCGLVLSTSGNVSLRLDSDTMLLSASGAALGSLTPELLCRVSLADGKLESGPRPSIEKDLHRCAYNAREGIRAILHCHSPWATIMACHGSPPERLDFIPEVPVYVRGHAYVPYAEPGSRDLAELVAKALADDQIWVVQLSNHGQVMVGTSWPEVIRRAVFFEQACWMSLQGAPLRQLTPEQTRSLEERYHR